MLFMIVVAMISYIIILQRRMRKVNREKEKRENNRKVLLEAGKKLLEAQIGLFEKEEKNEKDMLLELEIAKYIKDYLLKAMRDGDFNTWGVQAAHGYVVQEYPDVFRVFEEDGEKE